MISEADVWFIGISFHKSSIVKSNSKGTISGSSSLKSPPGPVQPEVIMKIIRLIEIVLFILTND